MRVIAGSLGGRAFQSPGTRKTHPMSDRMKGALFNILGDIEGLRVLDAFAGSGGLSFEAISRGAAHVVAIERDRKAQKVIAANIESLAIEDMVDLVRGSAGAWARSYKGDDFDVLLLDPPYDDIRPDIIKKILPWAKKDGIIVLSWPSAEEPMEFKGCMILQQRSYSNGKLVFYRRVV